MSVRKKLATAAVIGAVVFSGTLALAASANADDTDCLPGDGCFWQHSNKQGYFDGEYYADPNWVTEDFQTCVNAGHLNCSMGQQVRSIVNYDSGKNQVVFSDSYGGGHYITLTPLKYVSDIATVASSDGTVDMFNDDDSFCWFWSGRPSWCLP